MPEEQTQVVTQVETKAPAETAAQPPSEAKQPEPDWKAETAKERAAREQAEKERDDYRSKHIAGLKQEERDTRLQEVFERVEAMSNAWATGETDKLPDALKAIGEKHKRQAELTEELEKQNDKFVVHLTEIAKELGQDNPNDVPEFQGAVALNYSQFRKTGNPWYLTEAQHELERASRKLLNARGEKRVQEAVAQAKKDAAAEKEKMARDLGVLAEPVGGAGGAAGGITKATRDNIDALWIKHEREHPGEHNPYENGYREFLATGKV